MTRPVQTQSFSLIPGGTSASAIATQAGTVADTADAARLNLLTSGEEVIPRDMVQNDFGLDSGTVFFSYFTARKTETITQVRTAVAATAGAALTIARIGIYTISAGTLTLAQSTANDTALWNVAFTATNKALSGSFSKVAGTRYAVALLAVGTTMPVLECIQIRYQSAALAPRIAGELAGQANLPASQAEAGLTAGSRRFQAILLP